MFEANRKETIEALFEKHPKVIGQETLNNIFIELRNIGAIQKEHERYFVSKDITISKTGFIDFITNKFHNYTPYLSLKKANITRITKAEVIPVLKSIFKQEFQDNTWDAYAKNLINWFLFSDLDIKAKLVEPVKGRGNSSEVNITLEKKEDLIIRSSLKEIIEIVPLFLIDKTSINSRYNRDLLILGLIDSNKDLADFGKVLLSKDKNLWKDILKNKITELPKFQQLKNS